VVSGSLKRKDWPPNANNSLANSPAFNPWPILWRDVYRARDRLQVSPTTTREHKTMNTISRMKRIEDAKEARSHAINRFMADCQQEVKNTRQDMFMVSGIALFFCLVFLSALLGFN